MGIELTNKTATKVDENQISSVAKFALDKMGMHPDCELSITLVDETEMEDLHIEWMDLPGATDVLSFPMDELVPHDPNIGVIGDIVLCPSYAQEQAQLAGKTLESELALLTIHGILHCLGFDHAEPDEEREMFTLQEQILSDWNIGEK